eukprot:TRINITY_DN69273_c0_g1_i1.p1 TRINITY_DN69273_c0_g1~~TRINITY_DN69273_c0_g1_i1.p1  ORF type:complete len:320 (+),score=62.66 TRINITY_DN69273_c0_g1_i1:137-961(+)
MQDDPEVAHEILPGLFLGDKFGATDPELLEQNGVGAILMLCARDERESRWWSKRAAAVQYADGWRQRDLVVKKIAAEDKLWYPLLPVHLGDVVEFLDDQLARSVTVYMHCQAGVSRSAALLIAYLMYKHPSCSAEEASMFVRRRRSKVEPNANYARQLLEWEQRIVEAHVGQGVVEALSTWRESSNVQRVLRAKVMLDRLVDKHTVELGLPGREKWDQLKDVDALKHDIMNLISPSRNLEGLHEMLETQSEDFPDDFPFLDAESKAAILRIAAC